MTRKELQRNKTYTVSGEGIKKAFLQVDNNGELWYGVPLLVNSFECFTKEFQDKILRNVKEKK